MRNGLGVLLAAAAIAGLGVLAGCNRQATSSSEAIQYAKTLKTPEQQAGYLVSQAQVFVDAKDYQEAVMTAQYVLSSVDTRSRAAADVLAQANAKLAADARAVIDGVK